jgi:hypothetical protein
MSLTFNKFCHEYCDGLYDPKFPDEKQCTGYLQLKKMVVEGITPASFEEIERWEKRPTVLEMFSTPDIKYLRFLHPLLRPYVIKNWDSIKKMTIE